MSCQVCGGAAREGAAPACRRGRTRRTRRSGTATRRSRCASRSENGRVAASPWPIGPRLGVEHAVEDHRADPRRGTSRRTSSRAGCRRRCRSRSAAPRRPPAGSGPCRGRCRPSSCGRRSGRVVGGRPGAASRRTGSAGAPARSLVGNEGPRVRRPRRVGLGTRIGGARADAAQGRSRRCRSARRRRRARSLRRRRRARRDGAPGPPGLTKSVPIRFAGSVATCRARSRSTVCPVGSS